MTAGCLSEGRARSCYGRGLTMRNLPCSVLKQSNCFVSLPLKSAICITAGFISFASCKLGGLYCHTVSLLALANRPSTGDREGHSHHVETADLLNRRSCSIGAPSRLLFKLVVAAKQLCNSLHSLSWAILQSSGRQTLQSLLLKSLDAD